MPYKQQKSDNWFISYTDARGRRVRCSSGTTDHAEAKALEQRLRAEGYENREREGDLSTGFAAVMVAYLKDHPQERERIITATLREHFGSLDILDVKAIDIRAYTDIRREAGKSDSTIARELAVLSAAINCYATEHGIVLPNPVKGRKPKQAEGRVRWLSTAEAARLIDSAERGPNYLADFVRIGLHTGMRKQEMLGLEWSRVVSVHLSRLPKK